MRISDWSSDVCSSDLFEYLKGRPSAPKGAAWEAAVAGWKTLPSDAGAIYDTEIVMDAAEIEPYVTWGNSPEDALPLGADVPRPADLAYAGKSKHVEPPLGYLGPVGRASCRGRVC